MLGHIWRRLLRGLNMAQDSFYQAVASSNVLRHWYSNLTMSFFCISFFLGIFGHKWKIPLHILITLPAMLPFFCFLSYIVWNNCKLSSKHFQRCLGAPRSQHFSTTMKTRAASGEKIWWLPSSTSRLWQHNSSLELASWCIWLLATLLL